MGKDVLEFVSPGSKAKEHPKKPFFGDPSGNRVDRRRGASRDCHSNLAPGTQNPSSPFPKSTTVGSNRKDDHFTLWEQLEAEAATGTFATEWPEVAAFYDEVGQPVIPRKRKANALLA